LEEFDKEIEEIENQLLPILELEDALDYLSEGKYFSIEHIDQFLKKLPGVDAGILEKDIAYHREHRPKHITRSMLDQARKLKVNTEGNKAPVFMQVPRYFY